MFLIISLSESVGKKPPDEIIVIDKLKLSKSLIPEMVNAVKIKIVKNVYIKNILVVTLLRFGEKFIFFSRLNEKPASFTFIISGVNHASLWPLSTLIISPVILSFFIRNFTVSLMFFKSTFFFNKTD